MQEQDQLLPDIELVEPRAVWELEDALNKLRLGSVQEEIEHPLHRAVDHLGFTLELLRKDSDAGSYIHRRNLSVLLGKPRELSFWEKLNIFRIGPFTAGVFYLGHPVFGQGVYSKGWDSEVGSSYRKITAQSLQETWDQGWKKDSEVDVLASLSRENIITRLLSGIKNPQIFTY